MKIISIELTEIEHDIFKFKSINQDQRKMKHQLKYLALQYINAPECTIVGDYKFPNSNKLDLL